MGKPGRPKTRDGKCTKCRIRQALEGQSWCSECFSAYQANRDQTMLSQAEKIGFGKGVDAMVKTLADEFERYDFQTGGRAMLEIERVVDVIRRSPRPKLPQPVNGS
jgi:hypothetical protein